MTAERPPCVNHEVPVRADLPTRISDKEIAMLWRLYPKARAFQKLIKKQSCCSPDDYGFYAYRVRIKGRWHYVGAVQEE